MANNNQASVGCQLPSIGIILTIVFVVLKLTGNITWAWIWVLSPLWISILATIAILAIFAVIVAAVAVIASIANK